MMRPQLLLAITAVFCLLVAENKRSFVDSAPVDSPQESAGNSEAPKVLDEVKQLEDLKHTFGKTFSVLKQHSSVYTDVNGQREGHSETREEVKSDGKLLARVDQKMDSSQGAESNATPATRVRTEVEVPSRGIHKTMEQQTTENGNRRSVPHDPGNSVEKYIPYSGVQYSPLDMAEYVFWTGDEKGVTLAIEEFLQEGLMSREEAINFLQEIKLNLEYLQNHYSQQRLHKQEEQQAKERAALIQKALGLDKPRAMSEPKNSDLSSESLLEKKSSADVPVTTKEVAMLSSNRVQQQNVGLSDEDYEELLERLRVADFLYTEYSLEEVIYQLAKVMFSQSLTRGSAEAQEALQKFTNFLEAEAEQGHISRSLEKKVLDVLIAALTDTLSEQPHLVNAAREGLAGSSSNQLLHQLLLLNPGGAAGETVSAGSVAEAATSESHQSTLAKGRERQGDNTKTNKTT
ncbi:uncharacterized protein [Anabrus simplex]|uniref:uncharacterized protein n=1 Tax=Anabrus simplex TaxID=316456 RepID=UPI0035A3641A